ncbi:acyltransferase family protein [Pseudoduganella sp. FT25W]|uniref:Acyltransferase family protein n=1 Tax=Duganella alba TaxID=2666081 RepID=A0A6L5QN72_9BURK|nr:acyltransferase family protein [Duganella alba]MRX11107.1 acyltransferase family protein [Duganella alba]MRX19236.1 acyltransferase family protein [Duganella alba]
MQRNNTIDIAKGIGILLVALGHNWVISRANGLAYRMIYSFHMPLFFLLAGVFLNPAQRLPGFISSKADALLKPYALVLITLGCLRAATHSAAPLPYFAGIAYGVGSTLEWVQMWFLPNLFVTLLFAWGVLRLLGDGHQSRATLAVLAGALLLLGAVSIHAFDAIVPADHPSLAPVFGERPPIQGLPFSLDLLPLGAGFLLIGYLLRQHVRQLRFQPLWALAALLVFIASHLTFSGVTDLNLRQYGHWLITPIQALSGIYLVLSLAALCDRAAAPARVLAYLGQASLFILIFHAFIQWVAFDKLSKRLHVDNYLAAALSFVICLACSLAAYEACRRIALLSLLMLRLPKRGAAS